MRAPRHLVRSVLAWPVETQQGSRRNALVASTALTERRREHEEVEDFLETWASRRVTSTGTSLAPPESPLAHRDVI
jgi:hypothetical protein